MTKKIFLIFFFFLNSSQLYGQVSYFDNGEKLFKNKKYLESKFMFEKDIVYNPKNEWSYLYLAKIFNQQSKIDLEENNLNTVILLNPKNEEAIYLLTLLSIKNSNFIKTRELIDSLTLVCKKLCSKKKELDRKLENSLKQ
jgi:tetratricopeptide (TPR) repeat protein|tara:strand:- start:266 stop:685 length:420 start_codon:yes stop_codon:yes gene_type:complete